MWWPFKKHLFYVHYITTDMCKTYNHTHVWARSFSHAAKIIRKREQFSEVQFINIQKVGKD